jgi:hypothetical protein
MRSDRSIMMSARNIARKMMKMAKKINKKYFNSEKDDHGLPALTCFSCHHGEAHPAKNPPPRPQQPPQPQQQQQ